MKNLFITNYHINPNHIKVILDSKATKKNMLKAMKSLSLETPDNKKLIVYFS
jgi:hypothetical protein